MKKYIIITLVFGIFLFRGIAQPPAGKAQPGDTYGEKINTNGAIMISAIPALLDKKEGFETKVIAKVLDVCPKKGCWLKLAVNDSTTAFVKMKDYAFFIPTAAKGKNIVLEGEVKQVVTSVSDLQHYARDAKKSQAEIESITEPQTEIHFLAKGIRVVE